MGPCLLSSSARPIKCPITNVVINAKWVAVPPKKNSNKKTIITVCIVAVFIMVAFIIKL